MARTTLLELAKQNNDSEVLEAVERFYKTRFYGDDIFKDLRFKEANPKSEVVKYNPKE